MLAVLVVITAAVMRLTNAVASAIAQFQACQQHSTRGDQANLPGSSSTVCLSQPPDTSSLGLNESSRSSQVPSNISRLALYRYIVSIITL